MGSLKHVYKDDWSPVQSAQPSLLVSKTGHLSVWRPAAHVKMEKTTAASLRGSCERCRGQKLRCRPSSATDSGAPCERCMKARVSNTCVFNPRSRTKQTGPSRKLSGQVENQPASSRKGRDISTPALPGMSTFALCTSSPRSPEVESPTSLSPLSSKHNVRLQDGDDSTSAADHALENSMAGVWQQALDSFPEDGFLQQPPHLLFGADDSIFMDAMHACEQVYGAAASVDTSYSANGSVHNESRRLSPSSSNTTWADSDLDPGVSDEEKPGPLIELTALLAEMSPYENRVSKLSGVDFLNYPIGDVLFYSHRFYAILSASCHLRSTSSTSHWSTPAMLLALSCFITLTRIYSAIFEYLREQLSRMLSTRSVPECRSSGSRLAAAAEIDSYRGLRLSELQPICLCTSWDPTKKAVSMLLSSLGGAEGLLDLPTDVRIIPLPGGDNQGDQTSRSKGIGKGKPVLFEEGSMAALTNGHLYKTVRKQAKGLRETIEEVEELLKAMTSTGYLS